MKIENLHKYLSVTLFFFLSACPSVHSVKGYYDGVIGAPISRYIALAEKPDSYPSRNNYSPRRYDLKNGHWVYVDYPTRDCFVHLEVDENNIIVDYRLEGRRCDW